MATRNVIGWSLPLTFRTWAKPSRLEPWEIRRTDAVSTFTVSTCRALPKIRWRDSATFLGGADWAHRDPARSASSRPAPAPILTSAPDLELVPHPQAQQLPLRQPRLGPLELIVSLEHYVVYRLVGETESSGPPGERLILDHTGGDIGLGIVLLITQKCVQPLGRCRRQRRQEVVGPLDVSTGNAAAHISAVGRVDLVGVGDADVGHHSAKHQRAHIVTDVRRNQGHRVSESAVAQGRILIGAPTVPKRAPDAESGSNPLQP